MLTKTDILEDFIKVVIKNAAILMMDLNGVIVLSYLLFKVKPMPNRLTKITTKTGDDGKTHLANTRLPKNHVLVTMVGELDELNAHIGFILALGVQNIKINHCLLEIQQNLFHFGGELHAPAHPRIDAAKVTKLETHITEWNQSLPPLKEFLLPGGTPQSAACHIARTVCRRAERTLVALHVEKTLPNPSMLPFLNRLSDLLFIIARHLQREAQTEEKLWQR